MPFILASQSPRRKELFRAITQDFSIKIANIDEENYPSSLSTQEVPLFLAKEKAKTIAQSLSTTEYQTHTIIACDTVVILDNQIIGKPENIAQAKVFLEKISNNMHLVVSGVCVRTIHEEKIAFSEITKVYFNTLTSQEIDFYLANFPPLDKAGAYGIQEWIGMIGVQKLEGCYYNVMGLPVASLYQHLKKSGLL